MPVVILQVIVWFALWILFTIGTRAFHPTLLIAASAIGCLELASATGVYLNEFLLAPKLLAPKKVFAYVTLLFLSASLIAIGVVVVIQLLYDILWGPDPRRLRFWINFESDFAWIAVHIGLAAVVAGIWRRRAASFELKSDGHL